MNVFDAERHDRARVACLLLGEPEPAVPISGGAHLASFIAFAAVNWWVICSRPGSRDLPDELGKEFPAYADLVGWHNEPLLVGLLDGVDHPGWHPKTATLKCGSNPYRVEVNQNGFDNGTILAKSEAGKRYRAYVADCRKEAAKSEPCVRIP